MSWNILPKNVLQYFLEKIKSKFLLIRNHDILGAKNILPFPYTYGSGTSHGLTVTVNEDGSVTAQGTPTQNVSFSLNSNIINDLDLSIEDKVIFSEWEVDNQSAFAALLLNPSTAISEVRGDYTLTVTSEMVQDGVSFILFFSSGVDLTTPVTFKPMVRLATDPDSTWYSPALTNKQLTENVTYLNSHKSHVSANPSTTTGTLNGLEIDGNTYAIQGGGHTIKNDSGTALANKSNLKFAGTYSANSGDDSVVNIVRTVNSESAITQMSEAEKKGIIVVDDGQAEEIDAYDVPYGNSDVGTALDGKVNASDIVDNLTTNDATKPLSAKQGKTLQDNKVEKSGDTMTGNLTINREGHGSNLIIGNNIASGTTGASRGMIQVYSSSQYKTQMYSTEALTADRNLYLPNQSGTIVVDTTDEAVIAFTNTKCNTVYEIRCRKLGNVVSISTVINPSQDIAANEILTNQIPTRFRPTHNFAYFVSSNNIIIQVYGDGTMGTANISAAIPAGWYYPVNMVYIR